MKKFLTIIISAALIMGLCAPAFANEPETDISSVPPLQMYGTIAGEKDGSITVKNEAGDDSVILNLLESTWVIDAQTGGFGSIADRETDRVSVYYGPATTRSIPPQSNAVAVIINLPEKTFSPHYCVVEAIKRDGDSVRILTNGGSLYVTINSDTELSPYMTLNIVTLDDIGAGAELLLWYDIVALSYPGQTTALKAVILSNVSPDANFLPPEPPSDRIILTPEAGVASVNGAEVDLAGIVQNDDGAILLPLRQLCEAMGYEVNWIAGTSSVEISKGATFVTLEFGEPVIRGANGIDMTLSCAPTVVDWVTYVPLDFFEAVLGTELTVISFEG